MRGSCNIAAGAISAPARTRMSGARSRIAQRQAGSCRREKNRTDKPRFLAHDASVSVSLFAELPSNWRIRV